MSLICRVAAIICLLSSGIIYGQAKQTPLTKDQVLDLVVKGAPTEQLVKSVGERGIDFNPSGLFLESLRKVGAELTLIKALCAAKPPALTKAQVLQSLRSGAHAAELVSQVWRTGVDFEVNDEVAEALKAAGANEQSIRAIRSAKRPPDESCGQMEGPAEPAPPQPSSSGASPSRIAIDATPPVPVYEPLPPYTKRARKAKIEGQVVVSIVVDGEGNVSDAVVKTPLDRDLDQSALDTVRTWKFRPAKRNGVPVPVKIAVEVQFRLLK